MGEITVSLQEVVAFGSERVGLLDCPDRYQPRPGQYLPAQRVEEKPVPLPVSLFKVFDDNGGGRLAPLPEDWLPGDRIALRPPQGRGFCLPDAARAVGLLAVGVSPLRLLALLGPALAQDAAVTLFCEPLPPEDLLRRLPAAVEVSPAQSLVENLDWPDFLAVDVPHSVLARLPGFLGLGEGHRFLPFGGQILVRVDIPCHGLGTCGVCAVETSRGWRLACVDGPVFPLMEILDVA
jgi:hypothetical protein